MSKAYIATKLNRSHLTKEEKSKKLETEEKLKGVGISNRPPRFLNNRQKKIYKWLYTNLEPLDLLGKIDLHTITNACVIIDRLQRIDDELNNEALNGRLLEPCNKKLHEARKLYFDQYLAISKELCLSPSTRITINRTSSKEEDPLLKVINGKN